jgi:hypothetical protein
MGRITLVAGTLGAFLVDAYVMELLMNAATGHPFRSGGEAFLILAIASAGAFAFWRWARRRPARTHDEEV